jgi:hypothetical protein
MADELNEHHDEDVAEAKEELQLCRENVAALLLLRPDPRAEDPDSPSRHLSDPLSNPSSNTHHKPRAALYGANHHDVEALNERVAAYGELSIISALLVGAALATLVEGRTTAISGSVEFEIVAFLAEITASSVLAANIIGTAVILVRIPVSVGNTRRGRRIRIACVCVCVLCARSRTLGYLTRTQYSSAFWTARSSKNTTPLG